MAEITIERVREAVSQSLTVSQLHRLVISGRRHVSVCLSNYPGVPLRKIDKLAVGKPAFTIVELRIERWIDGTYSLMWEGYSLNGNLKPERESHES